MSEKTFRGVVIGGFLVTGVLLSIVWRGSNNDALPAVNGGPGTAQFTNEAETSTNWNPPGPLPGVWAAPPTVFGTVGSVVTNYQKLWAA